MKTIIRTAIVYIKWFFILLFFMVWIIILAIIADFMMLFKGFEQANSFFEKNLYRFFPDKME
jgi:hypothetical protein